MRSGLSRASLIGGSALVMLVALAIPVGAKITSPAAGTISGTVNLTDDGTNSKGCNEGLSTKNGSTQMYVDQGAGTTLTQSTAGTYLTGTTDSGTSTIDLLPTVSGDGSLFGNSPNPVGPTPWVTDNWGNGTYTVNSLEQTTSEGLGCSNGALTHATVVVTVSNTGALVNTGETSGAVGTTVTVSATLKDQNGVAAGNGQSVQFALNGGNTVTGTTSGGTASASLTVTGTPRTTTLAISYAGGYFNAAPTINVPFTVQQDATTTTMGTTTGTDYGQNAIFTATASSQVAGQGPPTGFIQFYEDGVAAGSPQPTDASGVATYTDASLSAATHMITAKYTGNTQFAASAISASVNQVVSVAPTSIGVVTSEQPSTYGDSIDFTATVTATSPGPDTGYPTGTITFTATPPGGGTPITVGGAVSLAQTPAQVGTNASSATSSSIALLNAYAANYSIEALYTPSANYAGGNSTTPQTVNRAPVSVSISSNVTPESSFGQSVVFSSTVTTTSSGQVSPTGTVTFEATPEGPLNGRSAMSLGQINLAPSSSNASSASTAPTADLGPGLWSISVSYTNSDGNFVSGGSNSLSQFVAGDPSTTTVSSSTNPSDFGEPVKFQATVALQFTDAGTPTGLVAFYVNGNDPPTCGTSDPGYLGTFSLVNGVATTPSETSLPVGNDAISACYFSGSADFAASQSQDPQFVQVVQPDPTTTVLTAANQPGNTSGPSVFGQPVTFTATVTAQDAGAGAPVGSVVFTDGATTLATVPLSGNTGNDTATLTTSSLSVGSHGIEATYTPGNGNFVGSNDTVSQVVNPDPTTTTVVENPAAVQGQPVTFTAMVTANAPGSGTPDGTVEFFINGADLFGGPVGLTPDTSDTGSSATSPPIAGLTPGTYQVTATYSGSTDFVTSTDTVSQGINQGSTSTTLTASPSGSVTFGTPVTLQAVVAATGSANGTPTGSVDFYDGSVLLGSAALDGTGTATLAPTTYTVGNHSFSAVYLGEADFGGSTSNTVTQTVGVISTTTVLASSENPSPFSVPVTFTATVTPSSNAGPGPGGTVIFTDGSTTIASVPISLSGGHYVASYTDPALGVSTHSILASYSGSTDYGSSASSSLSQVVNADNTSVVAQPANVGTMTATLKTAQGVPISGQTITFTAGKKTMCSGTTNSSGVASCSVSGLTQTYLVAQKTYTASFAATVDFNASSGSAAS